MRLLLLASLTLFYLVHGADPGELFQLDSGSYGLLSALFHDFSDSFGDSAETRQVREFPLWEVADIYRVYTKQQLDAMDRELELHSHYIYDPIKAQVKEIRAEATRINGRFRESRDVNQYEKEFVETGTKLISLQKLVLRIVNSKIEKRPIMPLVGRTPTSDLFQQLSELLLGLRVNYLRQDAPATVPSADAQLNWMDMMLRAMKRFGVPDSYVLDRVQRMEQILDRVRQIYELNQLAGKENPQINTEFISPYSYEATIRLVNLLGVNSGNVENRQGVVVSGSGKKGSVSAFFSPIMVLFRSFINLFSFGNLFSLITRGRLTTTTARPAISVTVPTSGSGQVQPVRYDRNSMQRLIQMLQDNQRIQQQQVGQNKLNIALKQLLDNQNSQQGQINDILKALAGGKPGQKPGHSMSNPSSSPSSSSSSSSSTSSHDNKKPEVNTSQIMKDIRDQRKKLNDLIHELEKPVNPNPGSKPGYHHGREDVLGVMRSITPMINSLSRQGMISTGVVERSRVRLLDILQSLNASNRETAGDENAEDNDRSMSKLGHALDVVLGDIIADASKLITN